MGGTGGNTGIKLEFYDKQGNIDPTRKSIHHRYSWLTAQPPKVKGVGSEDWLKEVYLAPDPTSLYALLRTHPPQGTPVPLTSASSQDVTVNYIDSSGKMKSEHWKTAIGEGEDTQINLRNGSKENLRLFNVLKLTQGDVPADPNHKLGGAFKEGIAFSLAIPKKHA